MRQKLHSQRGFTMAEMLAVVAIIGIIGAISVGGFIQLHKTMEMNRLDAAARQIYTAAQNRVAALQASGTLTGGLDSVASKIVDSGQEAGTPSDYPGELPENVSVYYLLSSDSVEQDYILTEDAGSLTRTLPGIWIIEISPWSGEVYSVFYSEQADFSWQDVQALTSRSREDRAPSQTGYFHGGELHSPGKIANDPFNDFKVEVINSEELYVKCTSDGLRALSTEKQSKLSITLEVTGISSAQPYEGSPTGTATWRKTYSGNDLSISGDEIDFVLDSMRPGCSFSELINLSTSSNGSGDILPGSNINVKATLTYNSGVAHEGQGSSNSLLESYDENTGAATICALRHLNNLRASKIGETFLYVKGNGESASISTITLNKDIDFDATTWPSYAVSVDGLQNGKAFNPLAKTGFQPLDSKAAFGEGVTVDGANHKLVHFAINGKTADGTDTDNVGLISTLSGTVCNLQIEEATIEEARDNVGTLIGEALSTAKVSKVIAVNSSVKGRSNVGGLVGKSDGATFEYCGMHGLSSPGGDSDIAPIIHGEDTLGGFVGSGKGTFTSCYAAVDVLSANLNAPSGIKVGGFAGEVTGGKISNSYASGDVSAAHVVGGFVGTNAGAEIEASYACGTVCGNGKVAGFSGSLTSGSITNCTSYGRVLYVDGTIPQSSDTTFHGFCASAPEAEGNELNTCRFLQGINYNAAFNERSGLVDKNNGDFLPGETSNDDPGGARPATYQELVSVNKRPRASHAYSAELKDSSLSFPFAGVTGENDTVIDQWGNWPHMIPVTWELYNGNAVLRTSFYFDDDFIVKYPYEESALSYAEDNNFVIFNGWNERSGNNEDGWVYTMKGDCVTPQGTQILSNTELTDNKNVQIDTGKYEIKSLWFYINEKTAANKKASSQIAVDSPPLIVGLANTGYWLRDQFNTQGGWDPETFSFRLLGRAGTIVHSSAIGTLGFGQNNGNDNNFLFTIGERLPGSSAGDRVYNVIQFDVGRYFNNPTSGYYRTGTVGGATSTANKIQYSVYTDNFTPTSDWFML